MSEEKTLAFEGPKEPYKGFTVKAWYLEGMQDALVHILKDGALHREFQFPAYKIWNIAAHFEDIVDGELAGNDGGYRAASWNGITPIGDPQPLPKPVQS